MLAAGCGAETGVEEGATVSAYVAAPLCAEARRQLERSGGSAGEVRLRAICLERTMRGGRLDLATIGANARRASEDSTTVAFIGEPDPAATRFSHAILAEAGITQLSNLTGAVAISKLLQAIGGADSSQSLRESVQDSLSDP